MFDKKQIVKVNVLQANLYLAIYLDVLINENPFKAWLIRDRKLFRIP